MSATDTPLVTVILVTYNNAQYVLETMESVKAQTWENIEFIVSDDGSTDDTIRLCSRWIEKNKSRFVSVKLLTVAQNTGIPSNCNRGLRAATGEWIKIIAGDDILLDNAVSENLEYARRFPDASFIISDVKEIDEASRLIRERTNNEALIYIAGLSSAKKQLKTYTRWPAFLNSPTFFYRSDVVKKVNYCDEEFRIYEDMTMLIRVLEENIKLYYMKTPTVAYRVHQNAVSRSLKTGRLREKEGLRVFRKYRRRHLNFFNPLDFSVFYENWLRFSYKGINGQKGVVFFKKFSLFYWYLRINGVRSY